MDKYTKAIMAALVAFGAGFTQAVTEGSPGGNGITVNEWVLVGVGTVVAAVAVWAVPNSPPPSV